MVPKACVWLCAQEVFLVVIREPYGILRIEPKLVVRKANALPTVLLCQPLENSFLDCYLVKYCFSFR